jgi:tetratricopeptide (TPR) repeat protein
MAAIAMATLGLAQYLTSNGKFLWFYTHPSRDTYSCVKGTFANENHFVHFVALGLGAIIWWLVSLLAGADRQSERDAFADPHGAHWPGLAKVLLSFGLGIVSFAGLLAYSRGGIVMLFIAAATCVGIYARASLLGRKSLVALATAGGMVGAALWIHGYRAVSLQVESLTTASLDTLDRDQGRRNIWAANWDAICRYPLLGSGAGSHAEVYPTYFPHPSDVEYTHAECGYLQVLLETGLPGLALVVLGILMCAWWSAGCLRNARSPKMVACAGAVTSGLVVSVVHSVFDFVWYLPACMSIAVILAACACRLFQLATNRPAGYSTSVTAPKAVWLVAGAASALVAVAMVSTWLGPGLAAPHWDRYLTTSLAADNRDPLWLMNREENEQYRSFVETTMAMREHLQLALAYDPSDPRANLRMAAMCLRLFDHDQHSSENAMNLAQIRDAALASHFPSREAQDQWLGVAIGQNRKYLDEALVHTHRALRQCPLQGQGYVYLAELAFLEGKPSQARSQYIGQALRVRPYHGAVLFAAGREAALAGQLTLALDLWKRAFHQDPDQREAIIALLAPQMPASFFVSQFQPDLRGMHKLFERYRGLARHDQARVVGESFATMLEQAARDATSLEAANFWRLAQTVYHYLGNQPLATRCAAEALAIAPNNFSLRYRVAMVLCQQQQYEQAYEHLMWCVQRKPDDPELRRRLRSVHRQLQRSNSEILSTEARQRPPRR